MLSRAYQKLRAHLRAHSERSDTADDEEEAFLRDNVPQSYTPPESSRVTRILVWACIVSLALSAVNLSIVGVRELLPLSPSTPRRPSHYIGLENGERNSSWPVPLYITNYPLSISQIDKENPNLVGKQRDIRLSRHVSVIAQFRIHDFGMDNCTFGAWLTPYNILNEYQSNRTYTVHNNATDVEIWDLNADPWDDLAWTELSYKTRPKRRSLRARLTIKPGATSVPNFECPSGKLVTFEIACANADCGMEFHQDEATPRIAWMIFQYPRISNASTPLRPWTASARWIRER